MKSAQIRLQEILDTVLLPKGILSHHLRKQDVTAIADDKKIDKSSYVVFRKATHEGKIYGDGEQIIARASFDICYYYKYKSSKDDLRAYALLRHLTAKFRANGWHILSGPVDLYDEDNDYNGIVIEVALQGKEL